MEGILLVTWYKNIKVRQKLITSFTVMIILMLLISLISMFSLNKMRTTCDDLYTQSALPLGHLATMYDNLATQRILISNMIIFHEKDPSFTASEKTSLAEKEQNFEDAFAQYFTTIISDEERAIYDSIHDLYFNDFAQAKTDVLGAISSNDIDKMASILRDIDDLGGEISGFMDEAYEYNLLMSNEHLKIADTAAIESIIIQLIVIIIAVVLIVITIIILSNIISKPLSSIMSVAEQVAHTGNMEFSAEKIEAMKEDAKRKDEIGHTSAAFGEMMDNLISISNALTQVASGDLSVEIEKASDNDTLGNAIESMIANMNNLFGEVKAATSNVSGGAAQIATGAQTLSLGSAEQASAVSELSATVSQVLAQTKDNADSAREALVFGERGKVEMGDTMKCMGELKETVAEIKTSSEEVSKVIKAIDEIAFQTNILALNAAVEAARAGQQGKGFAVVADEVRNLANKSADAAKESAMLIQLSVDKVQNGMDIVAKTSDTFARLAESAINIQGKLSEISNASLSQESAIEQINDGIDQIFQVVQNNTATAEESAAASEELSGQSMLLKEMLEDFKINSK